MSGRVTLLLLSFTILANGQSIELDRTADLLNGRAWEKLGTQRVAYLLGVVEGIRAAQMIAAVNDANASEAISDALLSKNFTVNDTAKELDTLYSDRANILIPIIIMVTHVTRIFKGTFSKGELERQLIELRKTVNK